MAAPKVGVVVTAAPNPVLNVGAVVVGAPNAGAEGAALPNIDAAVVVGAPKDGADVVAGAPNPEAGVAEGAPKTEGVVVLVATPKAGVVPPKTFDDEVVITALPKIDAAVDFATLKPNNEDTVVVAVVVTAAVLVVAAPKLGMVELCPKVAGELLTAPKIFVVFVTPKPDGVLVAVVAAGLKLNVGVVDVAPKLLELPDGANKFFVTSLDDVVVAPKENVLVVVGVLVTVLLKAKLGDEVVVPRAGIVNGVDVVVVALALAVVLEATLKGETVATEVDDGKDGKPKL